LSDFSFLPCIKSNSYLLLQTLFIDPNGLFAKRDFGPRGVADRHFLADMDGLAIIPLGHAEAFELAMGGVSDRVIQAVIPIGLIFTRLIAAEDDLFGGIADWNGDGKISILLAPATN
jgi:hypothetical protein